MSNENYDQNYILIKKFANEIIKKFCSPNFTNIECIKLNNLREVLIPIFQAYEVNNIDRLTFINIGDALNEYIVREFGKHDVDTSSFELEKYNLQSLGIKEITLCPEFEDEDPLSIGVEALSYMNPAVKNFILLPRDVPHFINFLKTAPGQESKAHKELRRYIEKFDFNKRIEEANQQGLI